MSKNESNSSSCPASGKTPVCLLLFVGFVFGFSAGYALQDTIHKSLSGAMVGGQSAMSEPIKGNHKTTTSPEEVETGPGGMTDAPTREDVEKPKEEKEEGEAAPNLTSMPTE